MKCAECVHLNGKCNVLAYAQGRLLSAAQNQIEGQYKGKLSPINDMNHIYLILKDISVTD